MKLNYFFASFMSRNLSNSKQSAEQVMFEGYSEGSLRNLVYPDIMLLINSRKASRISRWSNRNSSSGSWNF